MGERVSVTHRCGHTVSYRLIAAVVPAYRPCFACQLERTAWIEKSISPHIPTKSGQFAVAKFVRELLENEYRKSAGRSVE